MSGECDYCGSCEHVEGGCPIAKDPDKMWQHGYESGRIDEANRQSSELTTLHQRAEAAEKILGDIEEAIGADRRSDHTMLPGIVKDTHAIMLERSDALAATEQEKARLVSAMTAESERLAKRVAELEGAVMVLAEECQAWNECPAGDWITMSTKQKSLVTRLNEKRYACRANPIAKAAIDAAGGQQ